MRTIKTKAWLKVPDDIWRRMDGWYSGQKTSHHTDLLVPVRPIVVRQSTRNIRPDNPPYKGSRKKRKNKKKCEISHGNKNFSLHFWTNLAILITPF